MLASTAVSDADIRERMLAELRSAAALGHGRTFSRANSIKSDRFSDSAKLREDLGLDSLSSVEFVMAMEDAFDIELEDAAIDAAETVADLAALIRKAIDVHAPAS